MGSGDRQNASKRGKGKRIQRVPKAIFLDPLDDEQSAGVANDCEFQALPGGCHLVAHVEVAHQATSANLNLRRAFSVNKQEANDQPTQYLISLNGPAPYVWTEQQQLVCLIEAIERRKCLVTQCDVLSRQSVLMSICQI